MKQTILIIEDESGIADMVHYALTSEGFHAEHAATGQKGMDILTGKPVDLIILDIGLPDVSGFELLKTIREKSAVPVLFLTARSEEIDRVLGLELGADDYIVKPFSPRELTARVKAVLRRSSPGEIELQEPVAIGPFSVDANKRQVTYHDKKLDLSRYEYEILCLLLRRPGWVFSREMIMDSIWEEPEESFERTVDAHIKTIRAKLRDIEPEDDPIVTHRGVGYSLKEEI